MCWKPPMKSRASVADLQYPIGDAVERFRFGVALHVGRILYGNIGGGNRLDFTCIGPAVNLAARLEKIASQTQAHHRGVGRICRHLPGRVERSRRVSGRRLLKGRARLRPGRRDVGELRIRSPDALSAIRFEPGFGSTHFALLGSRISDDRRVRGLSAHAAGHVDRLHRIRRCSPDWTRRRQYRATRRPAQAERRGRCRTHGAIAKPQSGVRIPARI